MNFYFNAEDNLCATEDWVADYLFMGGMVGSREEAMAELAKGQEFCGWRACAVSDDITDNLISNCHWEFRY